MLWLMAMPHRRENGVDGASFCFPFHQGKQNNQTKEKQGVSMKKTLPLTIAVAIGLLPAVSAWARPLGMDSTFDTPGDVWATAAQYVQFCCIKAGQGLNNVNDNYTAQMRNAQNAGLYTIPYYRCEPQLDDASSEAAQFWSIAGSAINAGGHNLSPALDVEDGLGGPYIDKTYLVSWINTWYGDVETYANDDGFAIAQITYINIGDAHYLIQSGGPTIGGYAWIANTSNSNIQSGDPWNGSGITDPWGTYTSGSFAGDGVWDIWQYEFADQASSPQIPGIKERVDLDVFNGDVTGMVSRLGTVSIQ
jgi:hypothetical protein